MYQITNVQIDKLKNAEYNPRSASKKEVSDLKESIKRFGIVDPIIVNQAKNRNNVIIGGHFRVHVAKDLGIKEIPVVYLDIPDIKKEQELNLRLNKNLGSWDYDLLANIDEDLLKDVGFDTDMLKDVFPVEAEEDDFDAGAEAEKIKNPKSKLGEVYILGKHRLMCGDATKKEDVDKLMDGQKADMVFTDPPYGVDYDGGTKIHKKLKGDDSTDLYEPCCKMAFDNSSKESSLYLWHAGVKGIAAAAAAAAINAGYEIRCEIVWNKNHAQFGALSAQYKQKHEPCYYCFKKGKTVNWCGAKNEVTVWDIDRSSVNELHPTQKPIKLAHKAINNHKADIILDLFGGSGSTLIACEQLNRKCYMMEIDPVYCDVIRNRYEKFNEKK